MVTYLVIGAAALLLLKRSPATPPATAHELVGPPAHLDPDFVPLMRVPGTEDFVPLMRVPGTEPGGPHHQPPAEFSDYVGYPADPSLFRLILQNRDNAQPTIEAFLREAGVFGSFVSTDGREAALVRIDDTDTAAALARLWGLKMPSGDSRVHSLTSARVV
jgi:hypothetical protein